MSIFFESTGLTLTPVLGNSTVEVSATQIYVGVSEVQEFNSTTSSSVWKFYLYRGTTPSTSSLQEIHTQTGVNINPSGLTAGGFAYLDTGLTPGTTYYYLLVVEDQPNNVGLQIGAAGQGSYSLPVQTTVTLNYTGALIANPVTSASVTITPSPWNPAGNPWSSVTPLDFTGYTYAWYRSTNSQ